MNDSDYRRDTNTEPHSTHHRTTHHAHSEEGHPQASPSSHENDEHQKDETEPKERKATMISKNLRTAAALVLTTLLAITAGTTNASSTTNASITTPDYYATSPTITSISTFDYSAYATPAATFYTPTLGVTYNTKANGFTIGVNTGTDYAVSTSGLTYNTPESGFTSTGYTGGDYSVTSKASPQTYFGTSMGTVSTLTQYYGTTYEFSLKTPTTVYTTGLNYTYNHGD